MRCTIDTQEGVLRIEKEEGISEVPLYSEEAFHHLSSLWLKIGWNARYHYTFSWMGIPVLQLPEDLIRLQEVIVAEKPDLILETGVAFGGSLLFYATLLKALGKGKVAGIEVDLHAPNRAFLEKHPLAPWITLIEGDSTAPGTLEKVRQLVKNQEKILVILDSNHSKAHVLAELECYHSFVSLGSYLIVGDGFKKDLCDVPRGKPHWEWDHPVAAIREFLENHPEFSVVSPERLYNKSPIRETVTHFPEGWLKKTG